MSPPTSAARVVLFLLLAVSACAEEVPPPPAGGNGGRDARSADGRVMDMPSADAPPTPIDLARADAGAPDAPPNPPADAPAVDAITPDAAPADLAVVDASGPEAAAPDTAPASQTPPQGRRLLDPWLAAGHYKSWQCEAGPANPRMGSPHGRVRICSNDLASGHGSGPYPVGAASVKEIYYGNRIGVIAVSIKVAPGTGGRTWYWYEQNDMEGVGAPGCAGCHGRAGNDHVYIQVK
jgi:hypothetical protein